MNLPSFTLVGTGRGAIRYLRYAANSRSDAEINAVVIIDSVVSGNRDNVLNNNVVNYKHQHSKDARPACKRVLHSSKQLRIKRDTTSKVQHVAAHECGTDRQCADVLGFMHGEQIGIAPRYNGRLR
jgi:hypothetical protein